MEERFKEYPNANAVRLDDHVESATDKADILRVLMSSKENGTSVAIKSEPDLGAGFLLTAVEDIILGEGQTTIVLKPFDATGFILPTNTLRLADIDNAFPLVSEFPNPVLKNIEKDKNWFF